MNSKLVIGLFALPLTLSFGCGGGGGDTGEVTKVDGTNNSKYVISQLTLPKNSMSAAFDLDGDGTADNRLGNIIQAVSALSLDPQSAATTAVSSGSLVVLFSETSTDSTQQSATHAGVVLNVGAKAAAAPKFDGTDTLTIDTATAPAQFYGNIVAGTFTSNNPSVTASPVQLTIALPLVEGQAALQLPVTGGYITFHRGADGKVTGGQINGAIKKQDVDTVIIPAVAALITAQLQAPGASASLKMFDTDMNGTVTAAEIMGNALISNFLAPDVQMFQNGVYKPNPAKTTKDSLSLGFSFNAVAATY